MISAGDQVRKLKAYLPKAICTTYNPRETGPEVTQCKAALPKVVDAALKLYPLKTEAQRKVFANIVRRFTVTAVVFRTQVPFIKSAPGFTHGEMMLAQAIHRKYVLNPSFILNGKPLKKINVYSFIDKKMHAVTYKGMVELAAMLASTVKKGGGVVVPPPLMKEINLINEIFPAKWASHFIERMARLYLTSVRESEKSKADFEIIDYDKLAKDVVQQVRKMAWSAVESKPIKDAPAAINDTTAKAQYTKIDNDTDLLDKFAYHITDTFVLKAKQVKVPGAPATVPAKPNADHYKEIVTGTTRRIPAYDAAVADGRTGLNRTHFLGGIKAKEYIKALAKWRKMYKIDISFRNVATIKKVVTGKGDNAAETRALKAFSTHKLRMTSKNTAIGKQFRLYEQIKQADFIREQMVKALKRFYPNKAGITAPNSKANYQANRDAIDGKIRNMVGATVIGMQKAFTKHYYEKDGTTLKKSAKDMALRELEANDVVLKAGAAKNPEYVKFTRDLHKSTGGAPQITVIDPIVNGGTGNTTLRRAVAVRRYQDAKKLFDEKFKGKTPEERATLLENMKKTLVDGLKALSLDELLVKQVKGIKDDGSVKFTDPRAASGKLKPIEEAFLQFAKTGWLGKERSDLAGLANVKRPKANEGADSYVDIIDRSFVIFKQIIETHKAKFKGQGKTDAAKKVDRKRKLEGLARALVVVIRKLQIHHPDRSGSRWTMTGKGAELKMEPAKVPVLVKDVDGEVTGRRMVPGYKITGLTLKSRLGGSGGNGLSFAFPLNETKDIILGGSVELDVSGGAATPNKASEAKPKPEWNGVGAVDVKVNAYLQFKKAWNAKLSVDGGIKSYHADDNMKRALDPNEPDAIRWPSTLPEGGDSSMGYNVRGSLSIAPKVSETLTLKVGASVGIVDVQVGGVPTLGRSTAVGGGLSVGLKNKSFSLGATLMAGKPIKPVFGKDEVTRKSNAWMDKGATKLAVNLVASGVLLPGTFALAASYGFAQLTNLDALDTDGDGTLDGTPRLNADGITPLSRPGKRHAIGASATLGLIKDKKKKPRLVFTLSGSGIFGTNDVTSGMMGMTMTTVGLTAAGKIGDRVVISGTLTYNHLLLKVEYPAGNQNTEDTGGGADDMTKSGVSGNVSIWVAAYNWLVFGASVHCSNVANHADYPGAGPRCAIMGGVKVKGNVLDAFLGLLK